MLRQIIFQINSTTKIQNSFLKFRCFNLDVYIQFTESNECESMENWFSSKADFARMIHFSINRAFKNKPLISTSVARQNLKPQPKWASLKTSLRYFTCLWLLLTLLRAISIDFLFALHVTSGCENLNIYIIKFFWKTPKHSTW